MTTIKLKNGSGAPTAGDLVQGEPALDLTNKRLYTEDSGGTVIEIGINPTSVTTGAVSGTTGTFSGNVTGANLNVANWNTAYGWGNHAVQGYLTGNQSITFTGDVTGSGTTSVNLQLGSGVVGATELNVTGNGTTSQFLRSDGDGSFTWATPTDTTYTGGTNITLSGTTFNLNASITSLTDVGTSNVSIGLWDINLDGSDLRFQYNGVDVFKITTAGAVLAKDNVTAYGAP